MLKKQTCKRCMSIMAKARHGRNPWWENGDMEWEMGYITCPAEHDTLWDDGLEKVKISMAMITARINEPPPSWCPYKEKHE